MEVINFTFQRPHMGVFFIALCLIAIVYMAHSHSVLGLESHNLSGVILDSESGRPVNGACISLSGHSTFYSSGSDGKFLISGIPAGDYSLIIKAEGFHNATESIEVVDGPDLQLSFRMTPVVFIMPEQKVFASHPEAPIMRGSLIGSLELSADQSVSLRDAAEIVKKIPGVFIRENGPGGERTISVNGCDPSKVRVVFDGVTLNAGSGMAVDLNTIPVASISKVELYAGNGSIGGTLILTSRQLADVNQKDIMLSGTNSSFNTDDLRAGIGIRPGKLPLDMSIDRFHTDGDFKFYDQFGREKFRTNNYRDAENYFIKFSLPFRNSPEISLQYYHAKKGSPGPLLQTDSTGTIENSKLIANILYRKEISYSSLVEIRANSSFLNDDFISTGGFIKYDMRTSESKHSTAMLLRREKALKTELNFDYTYEDFQADDLRGSANDINMKIRRALTMRALAGYEKGLSKHLIPIGVYSHLGYQGKLISAKKPAYTYDWDAGIYSSFLVRASVGAFGGTSFQLPDYYSLFFKEDIYAVGNPNLRPEKGKLVGWRVNAAIMGDYPITAGYIFTRSRINDIIIWKQRFDGKYSPANIEEAVLTTGSSSFEIGNQNSPMNLKFQHNRYRPLNKSEFRLHRDKYLLFRPLYTASLVMSWGTARARLEISHQWVGKRYIRMENTMWLNDYQITAINILYRFGIGKAKIALRAGIENLGDEPYEIIERYPSPGRNYKIGIDVSL